MKYIKIFLLSALFFGVWMGIIYSFQSGNSYTGSIYGLSAGIVFGLFNAGFSYFADQRLKKKGINTNNTNPRQSRKISVDGTVGEAIAVSEKAILSLNRAVIKEKDLTAGTIKAKTRITWKSFGEVIKISTQSLADGQTLIEIKNSPFIPTNVIDYGKGLENVETIVSYLKSELNGEVLVSN
ncbi:hypothetical protein NIES267_01990 [Calothrix parasitica NIES-267]|uniref:Uncharacterized protein n=1 Tax=Calothrix parasitica NIES-267 TaxID=1973488 RepID=A0A1Z4LHN0_9CYAN|nr:hypothetical protein NIES267_01990 [Calothrix parasitica NIES-267]